MTGTKARIDTKGRSTRTWVLLVLIIAAFGIIASASSPSRQSLETWTPSIPRTWDDDAIRSMEIPLATPEASPKHISSDYYYRIPIRPIYRSYPLYRPDKEPAGYFDSLKTRQPEVIFDATRLKTKEDWIRAGEAVFDAPIEFVSSGTLYAEVRTINWHDKNGVPSLKDGSVPYMRYVVREKGKVELGILSCAMCHSRVMPDGSLIKGAQGNFPDDRAFGYETRVEASRAKDKREVLNELRSFMLRNYAAPWVTDDVNARPERMTIDQIVSVLEAIPRGACARQGSSPFYPARIPDLIGVENRRYLDSSGLVRHRSIGDLMRYAALNQGADLLSQYADFRPRGELPDPSKESRYSDEQLYALALYIYSLKPPPNPNQFDSTAERGQQVFEQEVCGTCHTPPLYTNNKLTPADGFKVPVDHQDKYQVMKLSVHTDPTSTLKTRRGTGYYKVPSLKGVWYRGPFEHNGSVMTLEDWFNPARLKNDYVPTGFLGAAIKTRPVRGHEFGLELTPADRVALIKFLKTL